MQMGKPLGQAKGEVNGLVARAQYVARICVVGGLFVCGEGRGAKPYGGGLKGVQNPPTGGPLLGSWAMRLSNLHSSKVLLMPVGHDTLLRRAGRMRGYERLLTATHE